MTSGGDPGHHCVSPGCALPGGGGAGISTQGPSHSGRSPALCKAWRREHGCWGGGTRGEPDTPGHLDLSLPGDLVSWWELGQVHDVLGGREVGELVRSLCESRARPGT